MGLLSWVGIYPMTFQLLMFAGLLYSVVLIPRFRISNIIDFFVIAYIFYILLNSLLIDYKDHFYLWKNDVIYTLLPMSFYFISKTVPCKIEDFIGKMTVPMTIVCIIGIYLYITNPGWYSAAKYAQLFTSYGYTEGNVPDYMLREQFRLSSIWVTPYVIGYANGTFILYLLFQLLSGDMTKGRRKITIVLFLMSFVVLILAGFKSLLLAFVLSVFVPILFLKDSKRKAKLLFGMTLVLLAAVVVISLDADYSEFFVKRFQDAASNEGLSGRLEHTGGGIELDTMFGAGFGHYGMAAVNVNQWFIQDSEYQKVLAELGYMGLAIFVLMLLVSLLSAFNRKCMFELCIIITYIISFIGSSSISAETTFPFLFWFALGSISRKTGKKVVALQTQERVPKITVKV